MEMGHISSWNSEWSRVEEFIRDGLLLSIVFGSHVKLGSSWPLSILVPVEEGFKHSTGLLGFLLAQKPIYCYANNFKILSKSF